VRRLVGLVAVVLWLLAGGTARSDAAAGPGRSAPGGTARLVLIPFLDGEPWELPPGNAATLILFGNFPTGSVEAAPMTEGPVEVHLAAGEYAPRLRVPYGKNEPGAVCHGPEALASVILEEGRSTRRAVPLRCDVQIREPRARAKDPFAPLLSSPVTLEWPPVPRAVRYTYELQRLGGTISGRTETIARGETDEAFIKMPLEPSLVGERYQLTLAAHGARDEIGGLPRPYTFRVDGGTPEPGTANARLVPIFDGIPLTSERDIPTTVQLSRSGTSDKREIPARFAGGTIELTGIETGIYDVLFWLDLKHPDPGPREPGDYVITTVARPLALLHDGETVRHEVTMRADIELVSPPEILPRWGRPRAPTIRSPVHVVWKPLRGAVRYRLVLQTPYADTEEPQDLVYETTEPSWTAGLPPNPFYFLIIEAHGARAEVGSTFVDFGVEDPATPAPAH
jgi:hypothetical protein